jgi:hypothetical protein
MTETPEQKAKADRIYREYNDAHNRADEAAQIHGKESPQFRAATAEHVRLWAEYKKLRPTSAQGPRPS